jgi:uncharacterized membrane protein
LILGEPEAYRLPPKPQVPTIYLKSAWTSAIAAAIAALVFHVILLRGFGLVPFAAISFLLGALISRLGWVEAGKDSARDPEAAFASRR